MHLQALGRLVAKEIHAFSQSSRFQKLDTDRETGVIRYEGPRGGPGMREMLTPTGILKARGLGDKAALITDGRFSGATSGLSVAATQDIPARTRVSLDPLDAPGTASGGAPGFAVPLMQVMEKFPAYATTM